jgi:hypothetical protein
MLLATVADPGEVAALDVQGLVVHARCHVRMLRPKAASVVVTATEALCVSAGQRSCAQEQLVVGCDATRRCRPISQSATAAWLRSCPRHRR